MEFGIFVQGHVPKSRWQADSDAEHSALMFGPKLARVADQKNWKYVWSTEHHFLAEYSHMSCPEVYLGYLAAITQRVHLGSAIFTALPQVNHPVRIAERVAMLDHLSEGRFEFGTGRGAGSREVTGFGVPDIESTRDIYDEVIVEFVKMWRDGDYSHDGTWFNVPPRNVLPKPWGKAHPAMWCAATNPASYEKVARMGLGAIGFNLSTIKQMEPLVKTYKDTIGAAEPVGEYVNDNVMLTNTLVCLEDGDRARQVACSMGLGYRRSLLFRYHDTFPAKPGAPVWPDLSPEPTLDDVSKGIEEGSMICGDPDECVQQVERYLQVGADQVVFGMPLNMAIDDAVTTLELFGRHVIPKFDHDPVHRTTHLRAAAAGRPRIPPTMPDVLRPEVTPRPG